MLPRISISAVCALVLVSCGQGTQRVAAPTGPRETCATRSMAAFPGAFTSRRNLVVGPLALMGARAYTTPETVREFGGNKFPLLVKAGHRVRVELKARSAALGYGPLPRGELRVGDGHRVVTFVACRPNQASGSDADGAPVTFWSGFLLADTPQCVRLRVWVDRAPRPRTVSVSLGKRC